MGKIAGYLKQFLSPTAPRTDMKLPAFNGSPLKKWNTSQLLLRALRGAESERAKTKLDYLHDLDFKGCTSCFACKRARGKSYGHCALKDDLSRSLKRSRTPTQS